jgi:hypothetical protein
VRRAVFFVSAAVTALLVACGLTADFSGLQGGAPLGSADAGPGFDAAQADVARPEASGDDAPAGADAPDAGADANLGFCASLSPAPRLCADFDEGQPLQAGWTLLDLYPAGMMAKLDTNALSPPGSFLSAINPSGAPSSARLQESVPALSSHVHVAFAMLLQPTDGQFELCALHEVTQTGATSGLFYKEEGGKLLTYLDTLSSDGGTTGIVHQLGAPPSGWLHVEIDMDVSDTGTVVVKHDGVVVVNDTNVPTATPSRVQLFVELGYYSSAAATGTANFDNVVVDWSP